MTTYIDQIKQIFPDLGEGYIEMALQLYGMNVDETVTRLLDPSSLHPRLRVIDKKLPRANSKKLSNLEDEEAKAAQKRYLREMDERAERDAYIAERMNRSLNLKPRSAKRDPDIDSEYDPLKIETNADDDPYNDDYDDQYDDMGDQHVDVGPGALSNDVDYDSVRRYNAMVKEEENEGSFWENSKNSNRQQTVKKSIKADKEYADTQELDEEGKDGESSPNRNWGPDKIKGGRVLGPDGKPLSRPRKNRVPNNDSKEENITQNIAGLGDGNMRIGGRGSGGRESAGRGRGSSARGRGGSGRGGNKSRGDGQTANAGDSSEMSKIDKRRKNDNKSKIGNHNRKDRALKKVGG